MHKRCIREYMARVLGLEEIPSDLRAALSATLRVSDEAVVLPNASRSVESGAFKNVVIRFSGTDPEVNPDIFSSAWFAGVSAVVVPAEIAEALMRDPAKRSIALNKLKEKIPSEMANSDLQVGPKLDGDDADRDTEGWVAGFDSGSCCVGLYSARQSRAPEAGLSGFNRAHNAYYLVCKAGGGVAAQTFHSRLTSALKAGKTLDECFTEGGTPGLQALRRVGLAAQRNRARIIGIAANAIGFFAMDTIGDNAACPDAPHRGAIPQIDVTYNCLRKIDGMPRSTWQYAAGCSDAALSQGLMASSNVAEGFVAFTSSNDEFRINLRNEAYNCVPFVTARIKTARELATSAADAHSKASTKSEPAHPDHVFIQERFTWLSKDVGSPVDIEPPSLWGSHKSEAFIANWARELGVASCKAIRMATEAVCVAAMEPAKLRAAAKKVKASVGPVSVR